MDNNATMDMNLIHKATMDNIDCLETFSQVTGLNSIRFCSQFLYF